MINLKIPALNSLVGGVIMAFATSAHLYLQGKITGISGILNKCIHMIDVNYSYSFLSGMLFMSSYIKCYYNPLKKNSKQSYMETPSQYVNGLSLFGFIIAGFLVGFGAKMCNGCTSGHGLCGLPRMSKRSIVAIGLFMIFGCITATSRYYWPYFNPKHPLPAVDSSLLAWTVLFASVAAIGYLLYQSYKTGKVDNVRDTIIAISVGTIFSYGLIQSGMLQRHIVVGFLTLSIKAWRIQLLFALGGAVGVNYFLFKYIFSLSKPLYKSKFDLNSNTNVDNKLLIGAAIFGIGWGLSGVCPGPAILSFYIYCPHSILLLAAMCGGIYVENLYDKQITEIINKSPLLSLINVFDKKNK
ncbi:hypothetical protein BCR32DRAFT_297961 [Anaeromyces robustus]|uniref:Uncharacterized protein n=1 Tax=Anaeromyces robustus TaxID=1754192 RepID=A0A1Y1VTX0_9FUNG|nr:hypothetical protein BCR32DRAFT_297961 [Anaeromyces robustus]|eukprot:ORX64727.1 hypothetical protein BCR32DRAFT_297961 [Anaeromyces robustus]